MVLALLSATVLCSVVGVTFLQCHDGNYYHKLDLESILSVLQKVLLLFCKTRSHCFAQAGLKLLDSRILLPPAFPVIEIKSYI
jgi:hypothetical protein